MVAPTGDRVVLQPTALGYGGDLGGKGPDSMLWASQFSSPALEV